MGRKPLTDPKVKFMQLRKSLVKPSRSKTLTGIPVSNGKNIDLPVGERPPHAAPIDASVGFMVVLPVQSGDADDPLFLGQVSADLWAAWQEEEDYDGKNERGQAFNQEENL